MGWGWRKTHTAVFPLRRCTPPLNESEGSGLRSIDHAGE